MDRNSPHYMFHPDSIGWLRYRHAQEGEVTASDLGRLLQADAANAADDVMLHYLIKLCHGELKQTRGRKPASPSRSYRLQAAAFLLRERADEIKAERKRRGEKHVRGNVEPSVQAADEIGLLLRLPTGRTLLNEISAQKKKNNVMTAPAETA